MPLLEIAVDTPESGLAALAAGADRLEVCGRLDLGGITPDERLVRQLRERTEDPLAIMVRPRDGNFVYSDEEFRTMLRSIDAAKAWDADVIVSGVLTASNAIDVPRTKELVERAKPLHLTFHRAFDRVVNADEALDQLIEAGARRLLTSGCASSAGNGLPTLARLVARGGTAIVVMPGGGVRPENVKRILDSTRATELHSAARDASGTFSAAIVRDLILALSRR